MKRLNSFFTETPMPWKRVILLALACGVVPGLLMVPDFLKETSLQQPGISFEFWIAAALLIILNCEKPLEAGLKTFVFFLISQPLIYLVQVPLNPMGWELFSYYPRWAKLTLLTLPGGVIAWYTKKGGVLGALILAVAMGILCLELPTAVNMMVNAFPRYSLSVLFIAAELVLFPMIIFPVKKDRIISFALSAVMLIGFGIRTWMQINDRKENYGFMLEGTAPFEVLTEPQDGVDIRIEGECLWVTTEYYGGLSIDVRDADGNVFTVLFSCSEDGYTWDIEK